MNSTEGVTYGQPRQDTAQPLPRRGCSAARDMVPHFCEDPLSGVGQRWSVICTPQIPLGWAASRDDYASTKTCVDMCQRTLENLDRGRTAMAEGAEFKLAAETYARFGQLFRRNEETRRATRGIPPFSRRASTSSAKHFRRWASSTLLSKRRTGWVTLTSEFRLRSSSAQPTPSHIIRRSHCVGGHRSRWL